jgi:stromal membrane-associated protein
LVSLPNAFIYNSLSEAKYQYKKFLNKSALVASKLGPSKSASSVQKSPLERSKSQVSTSTDQASTASVGVPTKRPIVSPVQAGLAKANTPNRSPSTEKNPTPSPSTSSVWNDLSSLATPGQNSSLPLQYQSSNTGPSQLQTSTFNGATTAMSYPVGVTSTGMGINPFQAQMGLTTSQQPMLSPFTPSHSPSVSTLFNDAQSQQPFGQPWVTHSTQPGPVMTQQPSFFQPQPQLSVQLQIAPAQSILSHSPNQQFLSGPMTQAQFLLPNPSQQFRSHSSQPQMQPLQPMRTSSGFLLQSPMSAQYNMAGMTTPGQPSFLGTTTMQMLQQQQAMIGAPQVHPMVANRMAPGENAFGGQMYAQGSQWGAM